MDLIPDNEIVPPYSQVQSYVPGDKVMFGNTCYVCLQYNGFDYDDIRVPGINAWEEKIDIADWTPNFQYQLWDVVKYEGNYYTLINIIQEGFIPEEGAADTMDLTLNPFESECWGLIGDYDIDVEYELSNHEYVVFQDRIFYPVLNPNCDVPQNKFNVIPSDPRNSNVKKHMLRLAIYELHKLISPNNVSSVRITDYDTSITWLRDASKMKLNPGIPRKLDEEKKPVADFAVATFMRDYDPYQNPWQI